MRGPAAVNRQRDGGYGRGRVGGKEHRKRAELLDCGKSLVGLLGEQHLADVRAGCCGPCSGSFKSSPVDRRPQ